MYPNPAELKLEPARIMVASRNGDNPLLSKLRFYHSIMASCDLGRTICRRSFDQNRALCDAIHATFAATQSVVLHVRFNKYSSDGYWTVLTNLWTSTMGLISALSDIDFTYKNADDLGEGEWTKVQSFLIRLQH
jgi:hypothetical protein